MAQCLPSKYALGAMSLVNDQIKTGVEGVSDGGSISKVGEPKTNDQIFYQWPNFLHLQPGPVVA